MDLFAIVFTLLLVMDPFGNIPVFVSILYNLPPKRQLWIIFREMLIALFILIFFLYMGQYILAGLKLSNEALGVAGALVLFLIAIKMIFPENRAESDKSIDKEPLIVPLAVPLVAGPSAISYLILTASTHPGQINLALLGLLLAWAASTVILLLSGFLSRLLGPRVLAAIERLMGMILITLAVQLFLNGISAFMKTTL